MLLDGLRSREVLQLQLEDLRLSEAQIRVQGKGNKERILPLPADAVPALQSYLHLERPLTNSPSLFVSLKGRHRGQPMTPAGLRSLFRHHRKRSQVPQANPHRFRHYAEFRTMPGSACDGTRTPDEYKRRAIPAVVPTRHSFRSHYKLFRNCSS